MSYPLVKNTHGPINYKVIINGKYSHDIIIPVGHIMGIPTNFFYQNISTYLQIPINQIAIMNMPRGKMMCPAEDINLKERYILVKV